MADERVQLDIRVTVTVPNAVWTRVGDWEVLQTSGANVNVTVDKGEVSVPCAAIVRRYVDRGPFPRYMDSGSVAPTELGEGALRVTW
jgi:hypothetical protein